MPAQLRRCCQLALCCILAVALTARDSRGAVPVLVAKVLREIPRTEERLAEAHRASRAASLQVPVGQSLQVDDFAGETYYDVTVQENGSPTQRKLRFQFSRLGVVSYGMEIDPSDQLDLPLLSKRRILRRVNGNYISIQLRVQRDLQTGAVYLYYKPFAAVGSYRASGTQEFATLMEDSVRDLRGLGLFVKDGTPITAENLRTFVAVNKNTMALENAQNGTVDIKPHYELMFVRARVDGDQVSLHAFGTDEYRTRLHYLKPYSAPANADDTTIKSAIFFTRYTAAKQSPTAKAARRVQFGSRATYTLTHLDAFAEAQGFEGGALDNVTAILDAIIDGRLE